MSFYNNKYGVTVYESNDEADAAFAATREERERRRREAEERLLRQRQEEQQRITQEAQQQAQEAANNAGRFNERLNAPKYDMGNSSLNNNVLNQARQYNHAQDLLADDTVKDWTKKRAQQDMQNAETAAQNAGVDAKTFQLYQLYARQAQQRMASETEIKPVDADTQRLFNQYNQYMTRAKELTKSATQDAQSNSERNAAFSNAYNLENQIKKKTGMSDKLFRQYAESGSTEQAVMNTDAQYNWLSNNMSKNQLSALDNYLTLEDQGNTAKNKINANLNRQNGITKSAGEYLKEAQGNLSDKDFQTALQYGRVVHDANKQQFLSNAIYRSEHTDNKAVNMANQIAGNTASVFVAPVTGIMSGVNALSTGIGNGYVNQYGKLNALNNFTQAQRQNTAQDVYDWEYNRHGATAAQALANTYQAGMSAADSMWAGVIGAEGVKALGIPAGTKQAEIVQDLATLPNMASGAAAQQYAEYQEEGMDPRKAVVLAGVNGAVEWITEKVPLNNLLEMSAQKGGKGALKRFLKSWASETYEEGAEEVAGDLLDTAADIIANGNQADFLQMRDKYQKQGMNFKDATAKATKDYVAQLATDFAGGALGGAVGGGLYGGLNLHDSYRQGREVFNSNEAQDFRDMEDAVSIDTEDEGYNKASAEFRTKAEDIANKLDNGEKVSNDQRAELAQDYQNLVSAQQSAEHEGRNINKESVDIQSPEEDRTISVPDEEIPEQYRAKSATHDDVVDAIANIQTADDAAAAQRMVQGVSDAQDAQTLNRLLSFKVQSMENTGKLNRNEVSEALSMPTEQEVWKSAASGNRYTDEKVQSLPENLQIAYNEGVIYNENAVSSQKVNAKELKISVNNNQLTGEVSSVGNDAALTLKNGETVNFQDVAGNLSDNVRRAYAYATQKATTGAANVFLKNMPSEAPIASYSRYFDRLYTAGATGQNENTALNQSAILKEYMPVSAMKEIYQQGVMDTQASNIKEASEVAQAPARKGAPNANGSWIIDNRTNKTGDIEYKDLLEAVGNKLGVNIEVTDKLASGINGEFDRNLSKIVLNANSDKTFSILMHEGIGEYLTKYNREDLDSIRTSVMDYIRDTKGADYFTKLGDRYFSTYRQYEGDKSLIEAYGEMVNDSIGGVFSSEKGMEDFTKWLTANKTEKEATTFRDKVKNFFDGIIDALRKMVHKSGLPEASRNTARMAEENASKLRTQILSAMDKAIANYQNAGTNESVISENENTKYSINPIPEDIDDQIEANRENILSMDAVSSVDNDVFPNDGTPFDKKAEKFFEEHKNNAYNPILGDIALDRRGIKNDLAHGVKITRRKLITFASIPDVISKGLVIDYKQNWKNRGYDSAIIAAPVVVEDADGTGKCAGNYLVGVVAQRKEDQNLQRFYLHKFAEIKTGESFENAGGDASSASLTRIDSSVTNKLLQILQNGNGENVKNARGKIGDISKIPNVKKLSLDNDQPVQQTKDLIAVHNLDINQLISDIGLGGFPMPSIAIIREGMQHSKYGSTSVVFYKDTIDPKASTRNKVYGGDAYTPEFPRIEYKINEKKLKSVASEVSSLTGKTFNSNGMIQLRLDPTNAENAINNNNGDIYQTYKNIPVMQLAYLNSVSQNIAVPTKEEPMKNKELIKRIARLFDSVDQFDKDDVSGYSYYSEHPEFVEKVKNVIRDYYDEAFPDFKDSDHPSFMKKYNSMGELYTHDFGFNQYNSTLYDVRRYLKGLGRVTDEEELRKILNDRISKNEGGYKRWIENLFDGVIEDKGIRNNKDKYTDAGNTRSWKTLHDPVTLNNIVKAMRSEGAKGSSGIGGNAFIAVATQEFSSVAAIHKNENMLHIATEEEYAKAKDDIFEQLLNIASRMNGNSFTATDNIVDAISKTKNPERIEKILSDWGMDVYPGAGKDIVSLTKKASQLPTGYFEAKPQRAVALNEIAAVVAPDNITEEQRKILEDNDINYLTYKAGDENDRASVISSLENIKFSRDVETEHETVPADTSDPLVYFKGTKAEQAEADRMEEAAVSKWRSIINSDGFQALEFQNGFGHTVVLSKSVRKGEDWQLSWFDDKGAIMHEVWNYDDKYHNFSDLPEHLYREAGRSTETDVTVLRDKRAKLSIDVDSEGNKLTVAQQKYFMDSKVRDDEGRLIPMYHGTENAGFTIFDPDMQISCKAFFFSDSIETANGYSGNHELFVPRKFGSAEDVQAQIRKEMRDDEYSVRKEGRRYVLYDGDDLADTFDNLDDVYMGWLDYSGFGGDAAIYKTYLNITNPYVVDGKGTNWDGIPEIKGYGNTTNAYVDYARDNGYDGVIFKNIMDTGLYGSNKEKFTPSMVVAAFDSNQIKSVLNQNPTDNEDIRYSLDIPKSRDIYEDEDGFLTFDGPSDTDDPFGFDFSGSNDAVAGSISLLEEGNEALKGTEVDMKLVNRIAREFSKGTDIKATNLADNMAKVFAYMQNQNNDINYNDMMRIATEVMQPVVDATMIEDGDRDTFNALKKALSGYQTIRLTPDQVEAIDNAVGYKSFVGSLLGTMKFSKTKGISLDSIYAEIANTPEFMGMIDPDVNEGEQPMQIYDAVNTFRPRARKMSDGAENYGDNKTAAYDMALRFLGEYYEEAGKKLALQGDKKNADALKNYKAKMRDKEREYRKSVRDRYNERLKRFKSDYRERYREKINSSRDEFRAKMKEGIAEAKAHAENTYKERMERQKRNDLRKTIDTQMKGIIDMMEHPTDEKHVAKVLEEPLADFISMFDFVTPEIKRYKSGANKGKWYARIFDRMEGTRPVFDTIIAGSYEEAYKAANDTVMQKLYNNSGSRNARSWQDRMQNVINLLYKTKDENAQMDTDMMEMRLSFDPDLAAEMEDLVKRNRDVVSVSQLDSGDLGILHRFLTNVEHVINQANRFYADRIDMSVRAAAQDFFDHADKHGKYQNRKSGKYHTQIYNAVYDLVNVSMLTPYSFLKTKGTGASAMYDDLRAGRDRRTECIREAEGVFKNNILKDIDRKELRKWRDNVRTLYVTENGAAEKRIAGAKQIRLSDAQIMSLYELMKRPDAWNHIPGGFKVKDKQSVNVSDTAVHLNTAERDALFKLLSDQQKELADKMQGFLVDYCSKWNNDVSRTMYGYEKYSDPHYFPMDTDDTTTALNNKNNGNDVNAIANQGFTKSTNRKATNALVISDIFDVVVRHISNSATYKGYATSIADLLKWWNYKEYVVGENGIVDIPSTKGKMISAYGRGAGQYIPQLIRDLNGEIQGRTVDSKFADRMVSNFKAAAVGANLRVAIQQPTAIMRAAATMDPKYILKAQLSVPQAKKLAEYAQKNNSIAYWKSHGFYDTMMGQSMMQIITGESSWYEAIKDKTSVLAQWGDDATWGILYKAVELETADRNKGIDQRTTEFRDKVNERFNDVIDQTQVVDGVLERSQFMRSQHALVKMESAFQAEPTKSFNMLYRALVSGNKKQIARSVSAFIGTAILTSLAASIVDAFRNPDDDKRWYEVYEEKLKENLGDNLNVLNLFPYVKDIFSMFEGYDMQRLDTQGIADLIQSTKGVMKWVNGEGSKTGYGVIKGFTKGFSEATGIPAYGALREVETLNNSMAQYFGAGQKWETSKETTSQKKDTQYRSLIEAIDKGVGADVQIRKLVGTTGYDGKPIRAQDIYSYIMSTYKEDYQNAEGVEKSELKNKILKAVDIAGDKDDAEAKMKEWDAEAVGEAPKDDYGAQLGEAFASGNDTSGIISQMEKDGLEKDQIASRIKTQTLSNLKYYYNTDKKKAAAYKQQIIAALVQAGYPRSTTKIDGRKVKGANERVNSWLGLDD